MVYWLARFIHHLRDAGEWVGVHTTTVDLPPVSDPEEHELRNHLFANSLYERIRLLLLQGKNYFIE